ncbi:F-actin-capping protein subunit beta [Wickerhamomyces ciferrii]|uniref:F-actin-capping protein subunit beta n=1 Tax=Wickerhamomyces ciferrii (strain ATCC 14091 / BCRC 22168 / CBS 111 / JCM 3599 / NBRC 0793 / NRRL Y-1031 F-60-10) TaxID=1206466 RepID=K0KEL4_WICCF|nr:F-actin-capping protein subunit beta [Wickerhamomyces ciferrii]CCH40667.1 F-actin-capping protein subunit beta [Wickerhamomyces ciferrii]
MVSFVRFNPKNISTNLQKITRLNPDLTEELLSSVDVPLSISRDEEDGRKFLICDYNRDLDSYRSPWSNKYYPKLDDEDESPFPSDKLRQLEIYANDSFDVYRDLYYEGGVSSVYFWDQEDEEDSTNDSNFAGVVLLKKSTDNEQGSWDSIHVLEVLVQGSSKATYKLTSTIILDLSNDPKSTSLSGNLIRQTEKTLPITDDQSHIVNIGTLVEEIESKLRNLLQEVYFGKTRDIVGDIRSLQGISSSENDKLKHSELVKGLQGI